MLTKSLQFNKLTFARAYISSSFSQFPLTLNEFQGILFVNKFINSKTKNFLLSSLNFSLFMNILLLLIFLMIYYYFERFLSELESSTAALEDTRMRTEVQTIADKITTFSSLSPLSGGKVGK